MKQRTYLPVIFIIFTGLVVFFICNITFLNELKNYTEISRQNKAEIVITAQKDNGGIKNDTIQLKNKITDLAITNVAGASSLRNSLVLNLTPKTLLYIGFHSMYLAISTGIMFMIIFFIWKMIKEFGLNIRRKEIIWSFVAIAFLLAVATVLLQFITKDTSRFIGGASIMQSFDIIFTNPDYMVKIIINTLTIVALVILFAIAFINVIASKLISSPMGNEIKYTKLQSLKGYHNSIAFLAGSILSGTVIGTSLQREMIAEFLTNINAIYPYEFIAAYGMSFTFILAMFFLPTMVHIKHCERETGLKAATMEEKTGWFKIGQSTIKEIETIFSVFLPLIVSLVDYYLKS